MSTKKYTPRGNLSYSTMYTLIDEKSKTVHPRWEACFGGLFGQGLYNNRRGVPNPKKSRETAAANAGPYGGGQNYVWELIEENPESYRFNKLIVPIRHGSDCSQAEAKWFWDNWVMPNIPDHLKRGKQRYVKTANGDIERTYTPAFKVAELDEQYMAEFYDSLWKSGEDGLVSMKQKWTQGQDGHYFKKVTFDLETIGPSDLYGCLALMRTMQETTIVVHLMKTLVDKRARLGDAWLLAWAGKDIALGHSLVEYAAITALMAGRVKPPLHEYSIVERWPNTWHTEPAYGQGFRRKQDVSLALAVKPWELVPINYKAAA